MILKNKIIEFCREFTKNCWQKWQSWSRWKYLGLIAATIFLVLLASFLIDVPIVRRCITSLDSLNIDKCEILGKSAWDWLNLLIAPALLATGGIIAERYFKRKDQRQSDLEKEIAEEKSRQILFRAYIDYMTQVLMNEDLFGEDKNVENEKLLSIVKARTVAIIQVLDGKNNRTLFKFLREAGLTQSISFSNADLSNTDLSGVDIRDVNFKGADFSNSNLSNAKLQGSNLSNANLNCVDLTGADLKTANLSRAKLSQSKLYCDFTSADLSNAYLYDSDLSNAWMSKTNLQGAHLSRSKLKGATLEDSNLKHARFDGADLSHAKLIRVDCKKANFSRANFNHAVIGFANFTETELREGLLTNTTIVSTDFIKSNFKRTNLENASLRAGNIFINVELQSSIGLISEQLVSDDEKPTLFWKVSFPKNILESDLIRQCDHDQVLQILIDRYDISFQEAQLFLSEDFDSDSAFYDIPF